MEFMKTEIEKLMNGFIAGYHDHVDWKKPLIGYADVNSPYIRSLRSIVSPTHYLPEDILKDSTVIISYFLPFAETIGLDNEAEDEPSRLWTLAYTETNEMFRQLNDYLIDKIGQMGFHGAVPENVGTIDNEHIYSNWSQRHIAYAAGLGTFGMNNMLITENGCCGRFSSLVTDLPVAADEPRQEEFCTYKLNGKCGICMRKCPIDAFNADKGYDRRSCFARLDEFERRLGTDGCGKCTVGLPCTFRRPQDGADNG
jgi:epoxyqueuosine reductase QueG